MNRRIQADKGFTLLEILIAILIFAVVISALFSSFKAFMISSEKVKKEVAFTEAISNVFKRLHLDLESLVVLTPPRYQKPRFNSDPDPFRFEGKEETTGQQVTSILFFPSFAHAKLGRDQRAGVARIGYYVKENKNNRYDLFRSDTLWPFPEEQKSCTDPVLCRDILRFDVTYKDADGEEYKTWNSDEQEFKYTFPASLEIKIIFGAGEESRILETAITLFAGRAPIE